jgi:hypothetical protein
MIKTVQTIYGTLDEQQLRDLNTNIDEAVTTMDFIGQRQNTLKDIIEAASDNSGIPKKIIKKMAKARFKQSFQNELAEFKEYEAIFESITEIK